jgi:hypothetical protein
VTAWTPRLCATLRHGGALATLRPMNNSSPFLAGFCALTIVYAAAWIALSKLMRARMAAAGCPIRPQA